jgi:alkanesulfonate monooxygenase SsuD/methylene tetrahydromethanopterin reductase-like flavin-dependent oxidoreductase (luciferase family)
VRLSAFTVVDGTEEGPDRARRPREVLGLARAAEAAGLTTLWVAEHHFHAGGACPSPPVLLAAVGAVTERLGVGSLVSVLPFHDPVDLAEQYALLDQLTNGRVSLGVGSGYLPDEFDGFGIDPAEKRALFDRRLATLRAALRGEPVRVERPTARAVRLNVRPVQRPLPPIRVAVQRREAVAHLARAGESIALVPYATLGSIRELAELIAEYRSALPRGHPGDVAAAVHVYAGDAPERARTALQRYLDLRLATRSTHLLDRVREDPARASAAGVEASGFALFGPEALLAERFRALAEAGVDELLGIFDFGGLPAEEVAASVRSAARAFAAVPA